MAIKTAAQARRKFEERVQASGDFYREGVENPEVDWLAGFTAAERRLVAGIQRAIAEGRFLAGARRAGNEKGRQRTTTVGVGRWQEAAPQAGDAYEQAMANITLPAIEEALRKVANMPSETVQQRAQKSAAFQVAMSEAVARRKGFRGGS